MTIKYLIIKILLNIQLIEASSDNHLWAEQYNKQITDIFKLQNDVAKNIADKINGYSNLEFNLEKNIKPLKKTSLYYKLVLHLLI